MTISAGNSTSSVTAGATSLTTAAINVSAGSLVYVVVSQRYPTSPIVVSTVTDVNSASYTTIGTTQTNGSDASFDRFYLQNSAGNASFTVTVTMASSISFAVLVQEVKGAVTSGTVLDATGSAGAGAFGTTSPGSVTLAPGANGEMMISCFNSDDFIATIPFAESTGFTIQTQQVVGNANQGNGALATKVVTTSGTFTPTWAPGGQQNAAIVDSFLSPSPPAITVQPVSQTAAPGSTAAFSVTATGATSYQWFSAAPSADLYGNVPPSWSSIGGATSSSYTTPTLVGRDNGDWFYCAVTNAAGTTNSLAVRAWMTGQPLNGKGLQGLMGVGVGWLNDFKLLQSPFSDMLARKTIAFGLDAQIGYTAWSTWLFPSTAITGLSVGAGLGVGNLGTGSGSSPIIGIAIAGSIAAASALGAGVLVGIAPAAGLDVGSLKGAGILQGLTVAAEIASGAAGGTASASLVAVAASIAAGSALGSGALVGLTVAADIAYGNMLATATLNGVSIAAGLGVGAATTGTILAATGFAFAASLSMGSALGSGALAGVALAATIDTGTLGGAAALSGRGIAAALAVGQAAGVGGLIGTAFAGSVIVGQLSGALTLQAQGLGVSGSVAVGQALGAASLKGLAISGTLGTLSIAANVVQMYGIGLSFSYGIADGGATRLTLRAIGNGQSITGMGWVGFQENNGGGTFA